MAINLSGLNGAMNTVTSLSGLILVSPQLKGYSVQNMKNNPVTLGDALVFHYEDDNTATLTSDITDHVVEDNTVVNDQIALKPEIVTVRGFIGEVNNVIPESLQALKIAKDKLTTVGAFLPGLSVTALRAFNLAEQAYQAANIVKDNVTQLRGKGFQNKQQTFFQQFYTAWKNRSLFTIQTPWSAFNDMAIQTFRAIQDKESIVVSDFEITFKKIRFAKVQYANVVRSSRNNNQAAKKKNNGSQVGVDVGISPVTRMIA